MATTKMLEIIIFSFFFNSSSPSVFAANPTFNVQSFGAKSGGNSDCTKAFLSAWRAACATTADATVYVPPGRFLLRNAYFDGKYCKNKAITLRIDGTLVAPSNYNAIGKSEIWLKFESIAGVSIHGGTLDGQGTNLWACKNSDKNCPAGATSLAFWNSNDVNVNGLASLNSQKFHIAVDGCRNVNFANVNISAPENSPNTDGIHVEKSSEVSIVDSRIATGDDCVSIGPGASDLLIRNVTCGPGHGVSIGSLGWVMNEAGVRNVTVESSTFTGTQNGVRVKTWARPSNGFVRDVHFRHLTMNNVENPIIIDQFYCPNNDHCPNQSSGVKISDVAYEDIHGTSATKIAVNLQCSRSEPCSRIIMKEVMLKYNDKEAIASCTNANGEEDGVVMPSSCFHD